MILGFLAAFGTALCKAGSDVAFKLAGKLVPHDEVLLLVQRAVEAILSLIIIVFGALIFSRQIVFPDGLGEPFFWVVSVSSALLSGLGLYLTIKALRVSDVSLVSPMTQLTPLILLVTSPLMLGEQLTGAGIIGVVGIVLGSYCMGLGTKVDGRIQNPLRSFKHLFSDKGVQYALIASFIYGITSNLDKVGVNYTSPLWWIAIQALMITIPFYLIMRFSRAKSRLVLTSRQFGSALVPGFTSGVGSILQMIAISLWAVPYVIAVKRLSSVFSILSGALLFREKNLGWRILGSTIMVVSTIAIILYG